jgi:Fe-S-cluster-containing hydrogenase component 2
MRIPRWVAFLVECCCCIALLTKFQDQSIRYSRTRSLEVQLRSTLRDTTVDRNDYIRSLKSGSWVKFISGASNQDLPLIRNMCFLYTLAGVDCIDLSADPAVIITATKGVELAMNRLGLSQAKRPLIMISVNDDDDPHFRKAVFDKNRCPPTCPRPCEKVCPARAIPPLTVIKESAVINSMDSYQINTAGISGIMSAGVIADRCYGCGRCIPICPIGLILTESYSVSKSAIIDFFRSGTVDAIEIHTLQHHENAFADLWDTIGDDVISSAKVLSISFPDMGDSTISYLNSLQSIIESRDAWRGFSGVQIWQSDGRPMSGDIGRGTAHKSSNLAAFVMDELANNEIDKGIHGGVVDISGSSANSADIPLQRNSPRSGLIDIYSGQHFIQLAGGTNDYSASTAKKEGLVGRTGFGGFAFGGYARRIIGDILHDLEVTNPGSNIEDHPIILAQCLNFASKLVSSVKE